MGLRRADPLREPALPDAALPLLLILARHQPELHPAARPAMDFPRDTKVYGIDNQYMFGPALLVNPVTEAQYSQRAPVADKPGVLDFSTIKTQSQYLPARHRLV
ncbi:MAG: hypothetical protein WKG07_26855 [Hymenobacter sp.]